MPRYIDGFVIPLPKKNLNTYRRVGSESRQRLEGARRARVSRMRGEPERRDQHDLDCSGWVTRN
jgi:hypothetical protein